MTTNKVSETRQSGYFSLCSALQQVQQTKTGLVDSSFAAAGFRAWNSLPTIVVPNELYELNDWAEVPELYGTL